MIGATCSVGVTHHLAVIVYTVGPASRATQGTDIGHRSVAEEESVRRAIASSVGITHHVTVVVDAERYAARPRATTKAANAD